MNLPEKLAREIGRVTELRCRYAELADRPQLNLKPVLWMMDAALEAAKVAAGSPDIEGQVAVISTLEGFTK